MPAQKNKLAIGLEESPSSLEWSDDYFDVPELDCSSTWEAIADWQGENNTRVVLRYCKANGKICPAFEYVNSYKTEGTQAGDWYLPAGGELYAIYGNKNVLNITLGKIEGTRLGSDYTSGYWSSSESSSSDAWKLPFNDGAMYCGDKNGNYAYVRPVLAF